MFRRVYKRVWEFAWIVFLAFQHIHKILQRSGQELERVHETETTHTEKDIFLTVQWRDLYVSVHGFCLRFLFPHFLAIIVFFAVTVFVFQFLKIVTCLLGFGIPFLEMLDDKMSIITFQVVEDKRQKKNNCLPSLIFHP